jgi:hypothetical protein
MKNLSNKTLQATYGGDVIGGSVVSGQLGAFFVYRDVINGRPRNRAGKVRGHPASPNHETLTFPGEKDHG